MVTSQLRSLLPSSMCDCNIEVPLYNFSLWSTPFADELGAVHNCQHFPISTERTEGGRGHDASVLILNVDILIMLPPGGYD